MEPQTIRDIAAVLFPQGDGDGEPADLAGARSEDVTEFSVEEVSAAVSRFGSRCRAPGPDGIPSRVWSVVHAVSPGRLVGMFNLCLREGVFPGRWKRARLALLAKPGKPEGTPSSYRPLCLLDDVGKIFEFLLASRMNSHMSTTGVGLSEWQFGFRSGRCTDDALRTLRERLIVAVNARRYAAAVSLDIRNAFNTVGWGVVRAALVRMGFPAYVRRVLDSYLSERVLHVCDDHDGVPVTVGVTCGVPQGSVLGPLLWNVAFDTVFRLPLPAGATIIGYADDTLVVSEGNTLAALQDCANAALATVAGHIGDLGLRLAVDKTEAVVFKSQYGPADLRLRIGDQAVRVCESLKYLGIVHEAKGTWYGAHYRAAADKARRVMAALRGLMPNLGGPRESRRRLLTSVVHSVMLYGAPTWAPDLAYSRTGPKVLASVQRLAALSSVCAYRTVSYEAGTVVARTIPIALMAEERFESNLVTASGDSDPQMPAVGSEQAGSRRSSSNDRRTPGVDSQAPGSPNATSAANCPPATERRKNMPTLGSNAESVASATSKLKSQLLGQQSALNRMLEMATALKATSAKSKSPQVQAAIGDILGSVDAVRNTHDMVVKAFKTLRATQALADQCPKRNVTPPPSRATGTQTDAPRPSLSSPTQGDTPEGVSREQQVRLG
ncbi:hypothetical protein QTP88_003990 [Uroleucon formosanum]